MALENLERHEESLKFFDNAIKLDSTFLRALANRSIALSHLGNNAAIDNLNKAINLRSDEDYLWRIKGAIYRDAEKYQDVLESYDKAIELDPKYIQAYIGKSLTLYDLGEKDLALDTAKMATE